LAVAESFHHPRLLLEVQELDVRSRRRGLVTSGEGSRDPDLKDGDPPQHGAVGAALARAGHGIAARKKATFLEFFMSGPFNRLAMTR
jgi:hypothetical protein